MTKKNVLCGLRMALLMIPFLSHFVWAATTTRPEFANDLGPTAIPVNGYLPDMQQNYRLFQAKCGICHTSARAINSEFVTSQEWSRYIKKMQMRPPCCNKCPNISPTEARTIWKFLTYDSEVRKTGANIKSWARHRMALLQEFKAKYPEQYKAQYEKQDSKGGSAL